MEWESPCVVLDARPYGEGDAVATVMSEQHGLHRGLARGGLARARAAIWQPGNVVRARWVARLADQLGSFTAEMEHPTAALAMEDALALAVLSAACAVAEGALPEREPHPRVFAGLVRLVYATPGGLPVLQALVEWEIGLLADLGYGLDLARCAVSGATSGLVGVSPRSGRAVTAAAAAAWRDRLLPLPGFLAGAPPSGDAAAAELRDGLRLTGHFLARDVFGERHRPLPAARQMLYDRLAGMADTIG